MFIVCDEAGHTGPDLLSKQQRYFTFASVNVSDDDAFEIIEKARTDFPVQMPELKASRLMASQQGRRLIASVVEKIEGRFAVNAHDKLLALCGWIFEYVFEPVFQNNPKVFYEYDFHRFIAMFCYMWIQDEKSDAAETVKQFQNYMRSNDISLAPILFNFIGSNDSDSTHPFENIRRFATANRELIAKDNNSITKHTPEDGKWTLDLSASALWSHLNHWGEKGRKLTVLCDDSKPLRAISKTINGDKKNHAILRAEHLFDADNLGWEQKSPIKFADSRSHPSIQLADIIASSAAYCYSHGMPEGFDSTAHILDAAMLRDSIFPDYERVKLENPSVAINYAVLVQLAEASEGNGLNMPPELCFELVKSAIESGELKPA